MNWLVKPFSMALLGWLFFKHLFLPLDRPGAGRPVHRRRRSSWRRRRARRWCSSGRYLTDGDPAYTLVQVSVNDLIMLVLFAPIVTLLRRRRERRCTVPFEVLLYSGRACSS